MKNRIQIFVLLVSIFAVSSCLQENMEEIRQDGMQTACDSSYAYHGEISQIIHNNCAIPDCHVSGTSASGDFRDFDVLKDKVESGTFETRVLELRDMPPLNAPDSAFLDACEYAKLTKWVHDGAPE